MQADCLRRPSTKMIEDVGYPNFPLRPTNSWGPQKVRSRVDEPNCRQFFDCYLPPARNCSSRSYSSANNSLGSRNDTRNAQNEPCARNEKSAWSCTTLAGCRLWNALVTGGSRRSPPATILTTLPFSTCRGCGPNREKIIKLRII